MLKTNEVYYSREELAKAILELQEAVAVLSKAEPSGPAPVDNTAVIDGMSQEINYLKDELNKAWARIEAIEALDKPKAEEAPKA